MTLDAVLRRITRQHGGKLHFLLVILITLLNVRFGSAGRKDVRREDWPGPGDTEVPTFTKGSKKEFSRRDPRAD